MNRIYWLWIIIGAFFLSSCSRDAEWGIDPSGDEVRISAAITPMSVTSRADIAADGKGSFSLQDRISLFVTSPSAAAYHALTLEQEGWMPRLSWSAIGDGNATFSAFYPEVEEHSSPVVVHTPALDQSSEAACAESDLLHAFTSAERGGQVELNFRHLMSRVRISLSSDGSLSAEELSAAQVSIRARNRIGVRVSDGTMEEVQGEMQRLIAHREGTTFTAVVCPQPVAEQWRNESWIEITVGDKTVAYKAPATLADGTAFEALKSGMQISLNIELKVKEEENIWNNTTHWVYGINNPPVAEWGYTAVYPSMEQGLKWMPEYGWFDCNKIDPDNHQNLDSQMCWAAASANTLYWWLAQNKTYIDRYGKYTGPNRYSSLDADIFKLYRTTFGNVGADVAAALDWFITGRFGMHYKEGAGFFEEVFGREHVSRITRFAERSFSEELKYCFTHKEAVECTVDYPNNLIHAISLWGADFDANGEVCAIYITDNNDRLLDEQNEFEDWKGRRITPAGLIRKRVQKRNGDFYMESSVADQFTFRILELNILGLMQERWEAYFSRH